MEAAQELDAIKQVCIDAGINANPGETTLELVRNLATKVMLVDYYRGKYVGAGEQRDILREAVHQALEMIEGGMVGNVVFILIGALLEIDERSDKGHK